MAELQESYSAYLPSTSKLACDAVLAVDDYPEWWSRLVTTRMKKGLNGKAMVGSHIVVEHGRVSFEYRVKRIEAGKRIDLECVGGTYRGLAAWTFEPEGKGTRVTFRVSLDPSGILARLLTRTVDVAGVHRKVIDSSLESLAARLAG